MQAQTLALSKEQIEATTIKVFSILSRYCAQAFRRFVGCFGLNGPLRLYFSLYRVVSQKEGERKRNDRREERINAQTTPTRTHCKSSRPLPYSNINQQDAPALEVHPAPYRNTRPPLLSGGPIRNNKTKQNIIVRHTKEIYSLLNHLI